MRGGKGRQRQRLRTAYNFVGFVVVLVAFFFPESVTPVGRHPAGGGKSGDVNDRFRCCGICLFWIVCVFFLELGTPGQATWPRRPPGVYLYKANQLSSHGRSMSPFFTLPPVVIAATTSSVVPQPCYLYCRYSFICTARDLQAF